MPVVDTKGADLNELTNPATDDKLIAIDKSDTSQSAKGSSKFMALSTLLTWLASTIQSFVGSWDGWQSAGEAFVYVSADDPTFVFKIVGVDRTTKYYPGMKIKLTQATGGTKFFIITKVDLVSSDTHITVYGGTDYNLENESISSPYYSLMKSPAGFPLDPTKWTVEVTDSTPRSISTPTQNAWGNISQLNITIPIGIWNVSYQVMIGINEGSNADQSIHATLSTANNSESDNDFRTGLYKRNTGATANYIWGSVSKQKVLTIASKTIYYFNIMTSDVDIDTIFANPDGAQKGIVKAVCAYL